MITSREFNQVRDMIEILGIEYDEKEVLKSMGLFPTFQSLDECYGIEDKTKTALIEVKNLNNDYSARVAFDTIFGKGSHALLIDVLGKKIVWRAITKKPTGDSVIFNFKAI